MDKITEAFTRHYAERIREYGPTALGVHWGAEADVELRHANMLAVIRDIDRGNRVSLLDVGCGYGGTLVHAKAHGIALDYTGIDVVEPSVAFGREAHADARFIVGDVLEHEGEKQYDYAICSGILTFKLTTTIKDMNVYFERIVRRMFTLARKGIAFNTMTNCVNFTDPQLYYRSPVETLAFCISQLSPKVRLDQSYPLYEFTTYVYRE